MIMVRSRLNAGHAPQTRLCCHRCRCSGEMLGSPFGDDMHILMWIQDQSVCICGEPSNRNTHGIRGHPVISPIYISCGLMINIPIYPTVAGLLTSDFLCQAD